MSEELVQLVTEAVAGLPYVSRRPAYGGTAWYAAGEMFAVVQDGAVALKLSPEDRDRALSLEGARLFDPEGGRPMRSLVLVPFGALGYAGTLAAWLHKSHAFASVARGLDPTQVARAKGAARAAPLPAPRAGRRLAKKARAGSTAGKKAQAGKRRR